MNNVMRSNGFFFRTYVSQCLYVPFWKHVVRKLSWSFQTNCLQTIGWWYIFTLSNKRSCKFKNYLNKQHKNIKLTSKIEENSSLSFLDITISRENNKFVNSVYRKATFSDVFTSFEGFIPDMLKRGNFSS